MKFWNKSKLSIVLIIALIGCDDFGDMNVDPNNPSQALPDLLLSASLVSISGVIGATTPAMYVQYFSQTQYTDGSTYATEQFDFNGWYTGALMNLQTIINSESATPNYKAAARVLKAYFFHMVTDRWGMVPYTEALKAADNFQPKYDTQETIYKGLITDVTAAVSQFEATGSLNGDILFDGDVTRWQQFGNTLRMVMALRLSDADGSYASSEFSKALSAGVIDSDVMYTHLSEDANASPWYSRFITRTDWAITKAMADTMKAYNDLRLLQYADPAPDYDDGDGIAESLDEINGMPYGVTSPEAGAIENAAVSFPGAAIRSQDSSLPIYTVAQVHFSKAEAIELGWTAGDAQTEYEAGITASWAQWDAGDATDYIAQADIAYSSASWKSQVGFQKWIAAYPSGYEAWAEWRRLDAPVLTPAPAAVNNSGQIPVRQAYPVSETELNQVNYDAAVAAQGPDILDTKLWWDKN